MKRFLLSLVLLVACSLAVNAMSYRKAREYAYFLTDKMAYELNLTPDQYERVYEVNLDYFLSVNDRYDIYSDYWAFRDMDLRYILFDWQYAAYCDAAYFYHPISWRGRSFVVNIYDYYRYRNDYYYARPRVYVSYRGSSWGRRSLDSESRYHNMVFSGRRGGMREDYAPHNGVGYNYNNGHHYHHGQSYNSGNYPQHNGQFNRGGYYNNAQGSQQGVSRGNGFQNDNRGGSFGTSRRGGNNNGESRGGSFDNSHRGYHFSEPNRSTDSQRQSRGGSFNGQNRSGNNANEIQQNTRSNPHNSNNGNNAQSGSSRNHGTQVFSGRR